MTPECLAPILESLDAFKVCLPVSPLRTWWGWDIRLATSTSEARAEEAGVGDSREDAYAARRAALDQDFRSLPAAGSAAYWQRIETQDAGQAPALEVLGRCLRERLAAGDRAGVERLFGVIAVRVQTTMDRWARYVARGAHSGRTQLAEDLAQECYGALWQALVSSEQVFLLENFVHTLHCVQQHVATGMLLKEGLTKRNGVTQATRVPRDQTDRLDAPPHAADTMTLGDQLADPSAEDAFDQAELSDVLPLLERLPEEQRSLAYERYVLDRSAEEIAAERGITARTVRNRLKGILAWLKREYQGGEEGEHGAST